MALGWDLGVGERQRGHQETGCDGRYQGNCVAHLGHKPRPMPQRPQAKCDQAAAWNKELDRTIRSDPTYQLGEPAHSMDAQ